LSVFGNRVELGLVMMALLKCILET